MAGARTFQAWYLGHCQGAMSVIHAAAPILSLWFIKAMKTIDIYTSGGTKFMLLESFTKHPSRPTADHILESVLCGRCGTVNCHPFYKDIMFLSFWGVEMCSMLGFYGERACRRRNQTYSLWEAQQAQLLSYQCICSYMNTVVFESDVFDVLFPITGIIIDPTDRRCTTMVTTGWYKISATTKAAEVEVKCDEEEKSCFDRGHDMS